MSLNQRQSDFVRHYTAGADGVRGNAKQAAIAAGYTERSAEVTASRMLRNPKVAEVITALRSEAQEQALEKLRDWNDLVPDAQRTLVVVMMGQAPIKKADAMRKAANDILDRALGKVPTKLQHSTDSSIDALLRDTDEEFAGHGPAH